jgi:hypothetical protein
MLIVTTTHIKLDKNIRLAAQSGLADLVLSKLTCEAKVTNLSDVKGWRRKNNYTRWKYKLNILFLSVFIVTLVSCKNKSEKVFNKNNITTITTHSLINQNPDYQLIFKLPVFNNPDFNKQCNVLNKGVKQFIKEDIQDFVNNCYTLCDLDLNEPGRISLLEGDYQIISNQLNLISIRLSISISWSNYDTPVLYYKTLNYDLKQGKVITIQDIAVKYFSSSDEAAVFFSSKCKLMLNNNLEPVCSSTWNDPKELDFFEYFNLTDKEIIFLFDEIILESSLCGNPEVRIPLNQMQISKKEQSI